MNKVGEPQPEQQTRRSWTTRLGSAFAAGTLLVGACTPSQPDVEASPIADTPSTSSSNLCEPTPPTCAPYPSTTTTEPAPSVTLPSICDWEDTDGRRQPLVNTHPLTVAVDGRCSPRPFDPVKIHATADLMNSPAVAKLETGDELVVRCMRKTNTYYQDLRGRSSASNIVLQVGTPDGKIGYISEPPVGYVDETQLKLDGKLPLCPNNE